MTDDRPTTDLREQPATAPVAGPGSPVAGPGANSPLVAQQPAGVPGRPMDGEVLPPRRSRRRFVLPLLLLAAIGGGGWYGYGWWTEGRFIVSTDDAYVKADVTTVAAKVAGHVVAVPVANNTRVQAGDVVARIDDGDYKVAVDQAKAKLATQDATIERIHQQVGAQQAALGQTKAQLASAQAELVRAEADYQRAQSLAQSDFGSRQRLDQTRSDREKAVAAIDNARAGIASAEASVEVAKAQEAEARTQRGELETALAKAERDLGFTVVTAPVAGIVANRAAEVGNYVQPGTRLAALVPLDTVYVEANFKETQLARMKPGQRVSLEIDAVPGRHFEGQVQSLAPGSGTVFSLLPPENATGNFTKIVQRVPVRVAVPAELAASGQLRPGLSVIASVHTKDESDAANDPVARGLASLRTLIGDLMQPAKANPRAARTTTP